MGYVIPLTYGAEAICLDCNKKFYIPEANPTEPNSLTRCPYCSSNNIKILGYGLIKDNK